VIFKVGDELIYLPTGSEWKVLGMGMFRCTKPSQRNDNFWDIGMTFDPSQSTQLENFVLSDPFMEDVKQIRKKAGIDDRL
jgi:hypothetical protein